MRRHFVSVGVIIGLSCALARAQTPQSAQPSAPQAVEASQPAVAAPPTVIEREGRLTIKASRASLGVLLPLVSEKTGVKILDAVPLADVRVTIDVEAVTVEEALRQLLAQYDTFFFFGRASTGKLPASLQAVWVYPRGQGASLAPIDATAAASTAEFIDGTNDPDPVVRLNALEQLVERTDGAGPAVEALTRALQDPDENVRAAAVDAAASHGVDLPEKDLRALALSDPSHHVRLIALRALANSPQIRQIAEAAVADGNEDVRAEARRILETLGQRKGGR